MSGLLDELRLLVPRAAGATLPYLLDIARLEAREAAARLRDQSSDTRPPG